MYEIKVLSNNNFDNLPLEVTKGSNISDSLGFADKGAGKAYVRYAAHPELQKYLINHELDELEADSSTHEDENGIRHKKFFKDLFLPAISFGLAKPEAPRREAAQTQFVEGYGNVPRSQAAFSQSPFSLFSGGYPFKIFV